MKRCAQCGNAVPDNMMFCTRCGAPVPEDATVVASRGFRSRVLVCRSQTCRNRAHLGRILLRRISHSPAL